MASAWPPEWRRALAEARSGGQRVVWTHVSGLWVRQRGGEASSVGTEEHGGEKGVRDREAPQVARDGGSGRPTTQAMMR